ncbi:sheath tail protein [Apilactobacillus ozensis DSM 23829 = JCM 17196]|uniref:Sheath tail protein n=2 Tax=Apilactobacillus ozensis TaxID=866801 RepID=A0A0R2APZ2_9LACO|nr:phage tail sheath C-terminal domain-containing protein [Apilactobacillus ozensis]KRM69224.1 sheath tail protein [Apilactobacillus ozensis DSM 23829 = JCM 17196]
MAGGNWVTQNKIRPGAYINTIGVDSPSADSYRGIVLLVDGVKHDWGNNGIIELDRGSNFKKELGSDLEDDSNKALRETVKSAQKVLYLNFNDGEKASLVDNSLPWKFTAKHAGAKGNNLKVDVIKGINDSSVTVKYIFNTSVVNTQKIEMAEEIMSDDYFDVEVADDADNKFSKLAGENSYSLTGGSSKNLDDSVPDIITEALETNIFNVVTTAGYPVNSNIHELVAQLVQDLREKEGYHVTAVIPTLPSSDYNYEGTSAVMNGVVLQDGTQIERTFAAGFFAGASASVPFNQSLTYYEYPEAIDTIPRLSNDLIEQAIKGGKVVFTNRRDGSVVIEDDINTLVRFTKTKPKFFAKNRLIRILDLIANDTKDTFEKVYIGKISNNATGRDLFKSDRITYLNGLQDAGCIEDFKASDIEVVKGENKDAVEVQLNVKPVDSMEKLYMTIIAE